MKFYCRVEKDSISTQGDRLTTFVITYPRVVLAEAVTHRMNYDLWGDGVSLCERAATIDISKNSASSRAVPTKKMREMISESPYWPEWTAAQAGMQGGELSDESKRLADKVWGGFRDQALTAHCELEALGVHKQDANRALEPFAWITQVVTSSRWDNFFALRCHHMAHPALRRIARMMYLEQRKSVPDELRYGMWHLPFVDRDIARCFIWYVEDVGKVNNLVPDPIQFSVARCAWVSYLNHDRDGTPEQMKKTYSRLLENSPLHASPAEHQATPEGRDMIYGEKYRSNLKGYVQFRKLLREEVVTRYDPSDEEVASWGM